MASWPFLPRRSIVFRRGVTEAHGFGQDSIRRFEDLAVDGLRIASHVRLVRIDRGLCDGCGGRCKRFGLAEALQVSKTVTAENLQHPLDCASPISVNIDGAQSLFYNLLKTRGASVASDVPRYAAMTALSAGALYAEMKFKPKASKPAP